MRRNGGCGTGALTLGVALAIALLAFNLGSGQYVDYLWFGALGYQSVFETMFLARVGLFAAGFLASFAFVLVNLLLVRKILGPTHPDYIPREEIVGTGAGFRWIAIGVAAVAGLIFGASLAADWATILLARDGGAFGIADPVFGLDVGFHVFLVPFYRLVHGWLLGLLIVALLSTVAGYVVISQVERLGPPLQQSVLAHVSGLGAGVLFLLASGYWLDRFDLLLSAGRAVYGAGYTDVNVRIPALTVLAAIAAAAALALIVNIFLRRLGLVVVAAVVWIVAAIGLTGIWPAFVQRLVVEPSELSSEQPYLESNIRFTRLAYGLDKVEDRPFTAQDDVTASDVARNSGTVDNIRLWDYRPLKDTYNQVQSIRLYYEFPDVDVDRYVINGQKKQVMISARELPQDRLAGRAQTWVARRLQFTHGYGVAMSTANEVTAEGLPRFLIRDVPPAGDIKIDRPGIYFGERTDQYVIVGSTEADLEFDYPRGEENVSTRYTGAKGVRIGSPLDKLLFALRLGDGNILFSSYLGPDSQILFRRNVLDRVRTLAPFLTFDSDPYIVVAEGKLVWIIDGYTTTDRYPYSEVAPSTSRQRIGAFNYIRNSVKVTIDAYDGAVSLYVADPSDPVVLAYRRMFPDLFKPLTEIPVALKVHLRYPEFLFSTQSELYRTYHMLDAQAFYNREDLWEIPRDLYSQSSGTLPMEPYYVTMRLPGETSEEFALILPFTPNRRDNMIAWLAARSDGDNYGGLVAIRFPKDRLVYGPAQIAARINQDPTISGALTLWNQQGSRVIRGNLLVIPIERSILYVEPLFLQAEKSQLPELKRIVLATSSRVVMEPTLAEALSKLLDTGQRPASAGTAPPPPVPTAPGSSDVATLVRSARGHFERAQERLRAGDFSGFGEELRLLEADLIRLGEVTGR